MVQANQHAISMLQDIRKSAQELGSFVAMEVAWAVSV